MLPLCSKEQGRRDQYRMKPRRDIKDMTEEALSQWLRDQEVAPYRPGQILKWIYHRHVTHFRDMTDLSKDLRQWLEKRLFISRFEPEHVVASSDGSKKHLFRLNDGEYVESVLIPERGHSTLCISSQVGCSMGCRFCLTGMGGLVRNLTPAEIVNQVCAAQEEARATGDPLRNIVLMGMGEPLANYGPVLQALRTITSNNGLQFSNRRVTLSTVGLAPRIDDLGKALTVNLAVSLNAADNTTRTRLMPVNRQFSLEKLMAACSRFPLPSRRMITFAYILIAGVNDGKEDARKLVKLLRPIRAKINLIPFNTFEGSPFQRPSQEVISAFQKILLDNNFTAMIRWSKGQDIGAACGQLRAGGSSGTGPARRDKRGLESPVQTNNELCYIRSRTH